jgi:hypothetical protein
VQNYSGRKPAGFLEDESVRQSHKCNIKNTYPFAMNARSIPDEPVRDG